LRPVGAPKFRVAALPAVRAESSVAGRLTAQLFLAAFFLAHRVQSFRNQLESLARDRLTTYVGQTVSAFLHLFQRAINALEALGVANDQVAIPLKRVESLCIILELDCLTSAPPSYIRFIGFGCSSRREKILAQAKQLLTLPFHKRFIKANFDGLHTWLHRGFR